jgi:2-polyprenyl-3-methyl-5-hydroxy-6-metoxy-1,4-benzoquinol methylase
MDQPELAVRQFGSTAEKYLTSAVHSSGLDLQRRSARATALPASSVLDLGCGAGHASFALARGGAQRIVACRPRQSNIAPQVCDDVWSRCVYSSP